MRLWRRGARRLASVGLTLRPSQTQVRSRPGERIRRAGRTAEDCSVRIMSRALSLSHRRAVRRSGSGASAG